MMKTEFETFALRTVGLRGKNPRSFISRPLRQKTYIKTEGPVHDPQCLELQPELQGEAVFTLEPTPFHPGFNPRETRWC